MNTYIERVPPASSGIYPVIATLAGIYAGSNDTLNNRVESAITNHIVEATPNVYDVTTPNALVSEMMFDKSGQSPESKDNTSAIDSVIALMTSRFGASKILSGINSTLDPEAYDAAQYFQNMNSFGAQILPLLDLNNMDTSKDPVVRGLANLLTAMYRMYDPGESTILTTTFGYLYDITDDNTLPAVSTSADGAITVYPMNNSTARVTAFWQGSTTAAHDGATYYYVATNSGSRSVTISGRIYRTDLTDGTKSITSINVQITGWNDDGTANDYVTLTSLPVGSTYSATFVLPSKCKRFGIYQTGTPANTRDSIDLTMTFGPCIDEKQVFVPSDLSSLDPTKSWVYNWWESHRWAIEYGMRWVESRRNDDSDALVTKIATELNATEWDASMPATSLMVLGHFINNVSRLDVLLNHAYIFFFAACADKNFNWPLKIS
jgi:hypothetical protein